MKTYKTVQVPASEQKKLDKHTCDICGQEIPKNPPWDLVQELVTINAHRIWSHGPDSGRSDEHTYDICGDCFRGKFRLAMELLGAKPVVSESDW